MSAINAKVMGGIMTAIVVVILFAVVPMIGSMTETAVPIDAGSQWNSTTNPDIPTGVDLWTTVGSVAKLVIVMGLIVLVIAGVIKLGGGF